MLPEKPAWLTLALYKWPRIFIMLVRQLHAGHECEPARAGHSQTRKRLHMKTGRQFVVLLLGLLLLGMSGCVKKKPQLPTQAKAPVDSIPSPLPAEIVEETPPPPPPAPPPEEPKVEEPKPQPAKHRKKKQEKSAPATTQANETASAPANGNLASAHPPANEAPADTAIAADVTSAQLTQQKQTTAQLLESTEKTLNGLHNLSHDDEQMVVQIRSYLAQSRKATTDGDFERAYNLATKAHLLSDALVKK
jgi:outer membrane biosynthesis protein TonB